MPNVLLEAFEHFWGYPGNLVQAAQRILRGGHWPIRYHWGHTLLQMVISFELLNIYLEEIVQVTYKNLALILFSSLIGNNEKLELVQMTSCRTSASLQFPLLIGILWIFV